MKRYLKFLTLMIFLLSICAVANLQAEEPGTIEGAKANQQLAASADTCWVTFDIDGDGISFTVADLVYLVRLLGSCQDIPAEIYRADLNGDCVIDSLDINRADSLFKYGMMICDPAPCFPIPTCCNPEVRLAILCGDLNCNRAVDILDITALIDHLYNNGPAPKPIQRADVNHSGSINVLDLTYLINFLYKGGAAPSCPGF